MLVVDHAQRRFRHHVQDFVGIEALGDPRRDGLKEFFAFLEQDLPAAADMHELNHGRGGEDTGEEANRIAGGPSAEAEARLEEEVVGDQRESDGGCHRRSSAEPPGDPAGEQHENQQVGLNPIDPECPGGEPERGRHREHRADGCQIREPPPNHAAHHITEFDEYGVGSVPA